MKHIYRFKVSLVRGVLYRICIFQSLCSHDPRVLETDLPCRGGGNASVLTMTSSLFPPLILQPPDISTRVKIIQIRRNMKKKFYYSGEFTVFITQKHFVCPFHFPNTVLKRLSNMRRVLHP